MGFAPRSLFSCPICRQALEADARTLRCASGHCFDKAKEGYVNLLPANCRHSDMPGDDREMVKSRTVFLDGGWYAPLREELCALADRASPDQAVLLDAGCGEGYYTEALCRLIAEKGGRTAGIDLSKSAVRRAARRCADAEIAVASVYHMPMADQSVDLLVDCFSPLAKEEFHRVLKPGGSFLYVVPGPRHLWEMKEVLYDRPYENEVRDETYSGFRKVEEVAIQFRFCLPDAEKIEALFRMTPYVWKTPKEGIARLTELHRLNLTAQFRILKYQSE